MKTISSIIIIVPLLWHDYVYSSSTCYQCWDLRPVNNNRNRNDGSLRFQQTGATGTGTGSETGGAQTEKTKDEVLDKKKNNNALHKLNQMIQINQQK